MAFASGNSDMTVTKSKVLRNGPAHDLMIHICKDADRVASFSVVEKFDGNNWYAEYEIQFKDDNYD